MPIVVTCPGCSTTLKAPDAAAGKKVKCPKCTSPIEVAPPPPPDADDEFTNEAPVAASRNAVVPRQAESEEDRPPAAGAPPMGQISRQTVGLVAIVVGSLGVHKFILGKNTPGIIAVVVTLVGTALCGVGGPIMWVIGIMEGVKYLRMSDAEFYETYVAGDKAWF